MDYGTAAGTYVHEERASFPGIGQPHRSSLFPRLRYRSRSDQTLAGNSISMPRVPEKRNFSSSMAGPRNSLENCQGMETPFGNDSAEIWQRSSPNVRVATVDADICVGSLLTDFCSCSSKF